MKLDRVEKIANAVLYEGYILYPYRPSAMKNQQRWNFGALYPQNYGLANHATDAWTMQTECLAQGGAHTVLDVKVRFLHMMAREVGETATPVQRLEEGAEPDFRRVVSLEIGNRVFHSWQEATEREMNTREINLSELVARPQRQTFMFPSKRELEFLRDAGEQIVGVFIRQQQSIEGALELSAERVGEGSFKITARILNLTPLEDKHLKSRDEALMRSFVSTHTILKALGGEFVSSLDPPEEFRAPVALCHNTGTYPVLVGEEGERDCILSSPIILYDYPQIAPESAGDFFDGTEIDEMLTLRVMTLTDDEKREMRGGDERARIILERTEMMPVEQLMKLHGAVRGLQRSSTEDER